MSDIRLPTLAVFSRQPMVKASADLIILDGALTWKNNMTKIIQFPFRLSMRQRLD